MIHDTEIDQWSILTAMPHRLPPSMGCVDQQYHDRYGGDARGADRAYPRRQSLVSDLAAIGSFALVSRYDLSLPGAPALV